MKRRTEQSMMLRWNWEIGCELGGKEALILLMKDVVSLQAFVREASRARISS